MSSEEQKLDPRLHFVVATVIVVKDGKFLIVKRAPHEKAFPNRWSVPGGKLVFHEYSQLPRSTDYGQWYNVVDWVLQKEAKEEVGLEIHKPKYLCDLVFIRPDGYPVVTLSYWAEHKSGQVKLDDSHSEYAWVDIDTAQKYDLIEGIFDELKAVHGILNKPAS